MNSKTFFKHIVIGSGLSASSVCNALELKNEKDYLVISPDSERLIRSNVAGVNDYLIENIGFQGLSKFWHGVFATSDFAREKSKNFFQKFFNHKFYAELKPYLEEDYLFIPKTPKSYLQFSLNKKRAGVYEKGIVTNIKKIESGYEVKINNKLIISCEFVWCCAGVFGTATLLEKSKLAKKNAKLSDHLVGYIGQTRYPKTKVVHLGEGHLKKIERLKGAILQFRPAFMDFKNIKKAVDLRNTFANLRSKIYEKLLLSFSPGLINEGMYNKLGIYMETEKKNVFFQLESKNCYNVEGNNLILNSKGQNDIFELKKEFALMFDTPPLQKIKPFSHLHYFNSIESLDDQIGSLTESKNFTVCDSSILKKIGPTHHSLRNMYSIFESILGRTL